MLFLRAGDFLLSLTHRVETLYSLRSWALLKLYESRLVERAAWCQPVKRGIYRTVCERSASYSRQRNKVLKLNSGSNQSAEMIMLQTPVRAMQYLLHTPMAQQEAHP
eukprot:scaffold153_cov70-Phaeocystis_antarctica.AAC.3